MVNLPYQNADSSLRALAGMAEGFGQLTSGGLHGSLYPVTSLNDDGCGSLREGCRRKEPLWIVFEVSGSIQLSASLRVSSFKTIDGRGQKIKITGKGFKLIECEHVIICNLELEGGRGDDEDGIQIKLRSRHIWIDRCSLSDFDDGLIDITLGSTDITISRCHFSKHNKSLIIGASSSNISDRCVRVTIHHCFFDGTTQRHPRVRFAKVHLYNNYTKSWGLYAVCASVESQIVSQCNIYEAGENKMVFKYLTEMAADKEESASGWIESNGDLFLNGAKPSDREGFGDCRSGLFIAQERCRRSTIAPASADLKAALQCCTGWQRVPRPLDCLDGH